MVIYFVFKYFLCYINIFFVIFLMFEKILLILSKLRLEK